MKMRSYSKPEKSEAWCFYPSGCMDGGYKTRVDLILEIWATKKRIWRLLGTTIELTDEEVGRMNREWMNGDAEMVPNLHYRNG